MANIFSLYGTVFIDNEKANKAIDETTNKGSSLGSKVGGVLSTVGKTALAMGTAVVTGATAVTTGLMGMANSAASTADEFDKASLRTGIQVEELQRLKYAAEQSGLGLETIEKSAKKLNDRLGEVSEGNDKTIGMFDKLGVSVNNADGSMRSSTEVYEDVLFKLAEMGDTAEATAIGTDLFGKAFVDMKPLLAAGTDGIQDLMQNADKLGIVMSEDSVKAGVKFGDTIADIKSAAGGMVKSLGSSMIPLFQTIADLIIENIPTISSMVSSMAPILSQIFMSIVPPLMQLAQTLLPIILNLIQLLLPFIAQVCESILPVLVQLIELIMPPLMQLIELILPLILSLIEPLLPLLQPLLELLQPFIDLLILILQPLTELLNLILPPLISLISIIIQTIIPLLSAQLTFVANIIGGVFGNTLSYITSQIQVVKNIFMNIIDFIKNVFTGNWQAAWQNVKQIFGNIISGITNLFKLPLNFIIDGMNAFIKSLNKLKIPNWVPGVGGKGLNLKTFNRLRIGIDEVPYDDYPALLHKGERVLTSSENKEFTKALNSEPKKEDNQIVYNNTIVIERMEVRDDKDIEKISEELYYLLKKKEA